MSVGHLSDLQRGLLCISLIAFSPLMNQRFLEKLQQSSGTMNYYCLKNCGEFCREVNYCSKICREVSCTVNYHSEICCDWVSRK